jgi:hypothetical protein
MQASFWLPLMFLPVRDMTGTLAWHGAWQVDEGPFTCKPFNALTSILLIWSWHSCVIHRPHTSHVQNHMHLCDSWLVPYCSQGTQQAN